MNKRVTGSVERYDPLTMSERTTMAETPPQIPSLERARRKRTRKNKKRSTWRRRYEKERGRRGSRLGRWVPDPSLVTVEPGLPATFYLPRPCVADVLRLQGILCLRTRGAVGLRARVPAEVSGRDAAGGSAWSTAPTGPPGLPCEQRGAVGLRARAPADVSSRDVAAGAEPTHQLVAWLTVRTTQASSRRSNEPRYEKERGRRGSRLGRWVPDPSLVTVEPGLPATFYLPRPCVADVLRLQGILCLRTRGAVGLRARVPAEVSGRDAAGGSAWSTAPTGPPGLPCEQRGAVGLRARAPADVSSRDVAAGAEPTHQLVAWLTVRTTQASSRRSNEPRRHRRACVNFRKDQRRRVRASTLLKQQEQGGANENFVDAAAHRYTKKFPAAVPDHADSTTNCVTVRTTKPQVAKQVPIALTRLNGRGEEVYSN
ncbi:hypothetical protein HPB51_011550 [Rhipicephalus microplus]|uniref:Uncharacterized protein n=1 Tax=Rhipicephalus microplus TaxID=6941 RepID=A0A9J6E1E3_RHIMP|nr:hypothetical protein HPB51_011550 [Rhipicephalus microplus]